MSVEPGMVVVGERKDVGRKRGRRHYYRSGMAFPALALGLASATTVGRSLAITLHRQHRQAPTPQLCSSITKKIHSIRSYRMTWECDGRQKFHQL